MTLALASLSEDTDTSLWVFQLDIESDVRGIGCAGSSHTKNRAQLHSWRVSQPQDRLLFGELGRRLMLIPGPDSKRDVFLLLYCPCSLIQLQDSYSFGSNKSPENLRCLGQPPIWYCSFKGSGLENSLTFGTGEPDSRRPHSHHCQPQV